MGIMKGGYCDFADNSIFRAIKVNNAQQFHKGSRMYTLGLLSDDAS